MKLSDVNRVYVGETGCSIYERAGESWSGRLVLKPLVKIIGSFPNQTEMSISRIAMRGGDVFNSNI